MGHRSLVSTLTLIALVFIGTTAAEQPPFERLHSSSSESTVLDVCASGVDADGSERRIAEPDSCF